MKFRKKPVVIEAVRMSDEGTFPADAIQFLKDHSEGAHYWALRRDGAIAIETLEGTMTASPGDWIIKGTEGELYPCKPAAFASTFEKVEEEVPA